MTVKELRQAAGMTQQAFANYFGIPKRNIENWEYGKSSCARYLLELLQYKLEKEGIIKKAEA